VFHPVRAVVVELASYEVFLGKPWFTRHNPIVDWRRHQRRLVIDGRTVVVDASASPQRKPFQDITRISATHLNKVVGQQEPVYLVHLSQFGVESDPAEGSDLPNAWECMHDEFSDVFPVDQPGLLPERSVAKEIELEEVAKPVAKPAFRLSPVEMDELKKQLSFCWKRDWLDGA
jgi:hypothetical protein